MRWEKFSPLGGEMFQLLDFQIFHITRLRKEERICVRWEKFSRLGGEMSKKAWICGGVIILW